MINYNVLCLRAYIRRTRAAKCGAIVWHIILHGIEPVVPPSHPSRQVYFMADAYSTMSSSAPPSSTTTPSILAVQISEKVTKNNYPLWSAQVLPAIRAAQLEGLLTGDEKQLEKTLSVSKVDNSTDDSSSGPSCSWLPTCIAHT
jgi:hypothetical protein